MKKIILSAILGFSLVFGFSQEKQVETNNNSYKLFDCTGCNNTFFVATNSGVLNTPFGVRLGFLCKTGAYLGARFGTGEIYYPTYDPSSDARMDSTTKTNLFSITGGLIKPIYIKENFSLHAFFGGGYGQWWDSIQENWTKEGYELEAGLMTSYNRFMLNASANMLNGTNAYATWDFTVGLGYRF